MLAAHREHPEAVLQGRTEPQPAEAPRRTRSRARSAVTELDWNYPTCNIAYPRALLERLGGFDEAYRFASAEDTDLGWRAREIGAPTEFVDDARAWHAVHRVGVVGLVRRMPIKADVARLTRRHPGRPPPLLPRGLLEALARAPAAGRGRARARAADARRVAAARPALRAPLPQPPRLLRRARPPRCRATPRSTGPRSPRSATGAVQHRTLLI